MKVKIGRDFYDKKEDIIYSKGEVADVTKEKAYWMVKHSLGYIIPNVSIRVEKEDILEENPLTKTTERSKAIEKSIKDKMVKKGKTVRK